MSTAPTMTSSEARLQQSPVTSGVSSCSPSGSMLLASSTSSLTSASSFSDSIKGIGPDVRIKENKVNQVQGTAAEYRPRNTPFMGIMDKTARFQQQNNQSSRPWHSQASDGLPTNVASGSIQSSNFDQFSVKHYQTKTSAVIAPGDSNQNGMQAKEQEEVKCQTSACCQDNRPSRQVLHLYPDALAHQHSHINKEGHLSHVTSTKPKRSFIESNV